MLAMALAPAKAFFGPVVDCCHYCKRSPHSGANVGYGNANLLRLAVRLAGNAHQAANALHNLVVGGSAAVGAVLAEPRD